MLLESAAVDVRSVESKHLAIPQTPWYEEDDHCSSVTGGTMSVEGETIDAGSYSFAAFQQDMEENVSMCQTYFMDGGNRFISLPTLGNAPIKAASHVARVFEDWIGHRIHNHSSHERLPIIEDDVELLAEDLLNTVKSRPRCLHGLSKVLIKLRTGHVYSYNSLEDGQPLITEDMEDYFFQKFPLFIEVTIHTAAVNLRDESCQLLLVVENVTVSPGHPCRTMQDIILL
ncbi:hypothetical protein DFQ28_003591 [Apophysomyces sp. BC1034]|nr:hypothetical protein DFQ30_003526 [Apophysomyces sp. BC1015]KAG0179022.1 hypothetical protein DFQ29_002702 [Apophysomyces sp. BC1021]KAG0189299.1 hypothetical protein DFQ28_003591 [Apophysomyces sp. BC1034]